MSLTVSFHLFSLMYMRPRKAGYILRDAAMAMRISAASLAYLLSSSFRYTAASINMAVRNEMLPLSIQPDMKGAERSTAVVRAVPLTCGHSGRI